MKDEECVSLSACVLNLKVKASVTLADLPLCRTAVDFSRSLE